MTIYYAETHLGCTLEGADSMEEAKASVVHECGQANFISIRKATKKDIEWVRGMGGYVPELAVREK